MSHRHSPILSRVLFWGRQMGSWMRRSSQLVRWLWRIGSSFAATTPGNSFISIIISRVLQSLWIPAIWLCHHPLHGEDSVCLQILLRVDNVVHGLLVVTVMGRWLGETPFVQVSTTWALICPETVHQRPCMTVEIETSPSDSSVGNNSVVDHRSRRPVLSPLRNCVGRYHVWASRCKPWRWMLKRGSSAR